MKKIVTILTFFLLTSVVLFSCKKDEPVATIKAPTKTELLTAHDWKISKITALNGTDISAIALAFGVNINDYLDYVLKFDTNFDFLVKKTADTTFTNSGKWQFKENEQIVNFNFLSANQDAQIISITDNSLVLNLKIQNVGIQATFIK
ncbi:MAG: hypothetical protein KA313_02650 [Pseudarcicella sp.]|nr:hypothetical protein [Pseudarcicella sp.]MBP6409979.1 hypothetical protein [Pseudarcicella sp.]